MKIVATTSLPAVDRPNADRWNAARSRQNCDPDMSRIEIRTRPYLEIKKSGHVQIFCFSIENRKSGHFKISIFTLEKKIQTGNIFSLQYHNPHKNLVQILIHQWKISNLDKLVRGDILGKKFGKSHNFYFFLRGGGGLQNIPNFNLGIFETHFFKND